MAPRVWLLLAALLGAVGVSLGAWSAHGLEGFLQARGFEDATRRLENFETANRYVMMHVPALAIVGLLLALAGGSRSERRAGRRTLQAAGGAFVIGLLLFCGLLYGWSVGGPRYFVHIVPIGGVSLIVGWLLLGCAAWRMLGSGGVGANDGV